MIIRIVKMTFQPDKVDDFIGVFNEAKKQIQNFDGCKNLELWEDTDKDNMFFTYSEWNDKESLENYRNSELFTDTWGRTKILFSEKPEAWSLQLSS